jgi:hypothetical protein
MDNKQDGHGQAERAADRARHVLEQEKDAGADRLAEMAEAIRSAGERLEPELPGAAHFIETAATNLHEASGSLRARKPEELLEAVSDLARRQPALFFGGAIIAGIALSRMLRNGQPTGRR